MANIDDYRAFFVREFSRRQAKNSAYTLNAFARDLNLSAPRLNQILKGRAGVSLQVARPLVKKLNLTELEAELFLALIQAKHARSSTAREQALEQIAAVESKRAEFALTADSFVRLSQWYHWVAYLLVEVADFKADMDWVAQRIGISAAQAIEAYESLFEQGFIAKTPDGNWICTQRKFLFDAKISTDEVRAIHRQVLKKAAASIDAEPVSSRYLSSSFLTTTPETRERIKERIDAFVTQIIEEFSQPTNAGERVYSMALQLFPLDAKEIQP